MAADGAKGLARFGETGFVVEAFAEVLDDIQPGFGVQLEPFQNRSAVFGDSSNFIRSKPTAGPVEQSQILIHSHRQAAHVSLRIVLSSDSVGSAPKAVFIASLPIKSPPSQSDLIIGPSFHNIWPSQNSPMT